MKIKVNAAKALYMKGFGPATVEYRQPVYKTSRGKSSFGRFYARRQALQGVSKKIRSLAVDGRLVEMDIAASHQTMAIAE